MDHAKTPPQPLPTRGRGLNCRSVRGWKQAVAAGSLPPCGGDGRQARGGLCSTCNSFALKAWIATRSPTPGNPSWFGQFHSPWPGRWKVPLTKVVYMTPSSAPFGVGRRATPVSLRGYRHFSGGRSRPSPPRPERIIFRQSSRRSLCVPHRHAPILFQTGGKPFSANPPGEGLRLSPTRHRPRLTATPGSVSIGGTGL